MSDAFQFHMPQIGGPYENAAAVAPDDNNDLPNASTGIYVGGAGNVVVVLVSGAKVTLNALAVGVIHKLRVARVLATGTTATNIVALW